MNESTATGASGTPAIEVEDLGKCYRIYDQPRDRIKQALWRSRRRYFREFWALRHVSFTVARGESVGIVGRNGSGKSTLLQLICGTLTPTEGRVRTGGRVAALLELGSGFNPEFTGIENVYLNASLLGLRRQEVDARLDAILAFADIGDFAGQPVKTYSSGMAVRLAFAVMAHVDADVLVVDEALSVGDAYFMQKCMRFIHRFREHGCLLVVSHDAATLTAVCDRALLISQGRLQRIGTAKAISEEYIRDLHADLPGGNGGSGHQGHGGEGVGSQSLGSEGGGDDSRSGSGSGGDNGAGDGAPGAGADHLAAQARAAEAWIDYRREAINSSNLANFLEITQFDTALQGSESFGNGEASVRDVRLLDGRTGRPLLVALGGERVCLLIEGVAHRDIAQPIIGFLLRNEKGIVLLGDNTNNGWGGQGATAVRAGQRYGASFEFTLPLLPAGSYSITAALARGDQRSHTQLHWLHDALIFHSTSTPVAAGLVGVAMHSIRFHPPT